MKITRFVLILAAPIILTSCFHKNVLNDRADNILSTLVYQGKEGNFIICKEAVFQATSKSSGQGFTKISGYNEYRLSSYDVSTGKLSARVNLKSGGDDGECYVLGETDGKIWCVSMDKDLGLHCRNPKTLEVIANQQQLDSNPQLKAIALAKPKWYDVPRYYAFNWRNKKLMISDVQGYTYYYNPANDSVTRTDDKITAGFSNEYLGSYCQIGENRYLTFKGDNRKSISMGDREIPGLSFLFGQTILDFNEQRAADAKNKYESELRTSMKNLQDSIALYKKQQEAAKKDADPFAYDRDFDKSENEYRQERALDEIEEYFKYPPTDKRALLTDDKSNLLVYHAADVTDTSRLMISKIKLVGDTAGIEVWKCSLKEFYFEPEKAQQKGAFETVFSKGDPELRYQWFDIVDGKLIMISQLQMVAIDMNTGKELWEVNI